MTVAASPELVRQIVKEDHRLEGAQSRATLELMQHRWHWTRNPGNPEKMSERDYAKAVGRKKPTIHKYATAYEMHLSGGYVHVTTPTDLCELALLNESTAAAVQAVAQHHQYKGRDISIINARQHHRDEWKAIRDLARDRAEANGTSELEEMPAAVEEFYRQPQAPKVSERQRLEEEQRHLREEHQRQEAERQRLAEERQQQEAERRRLQAEREDLEAEREDLEAEREAERQRLEAGRQAELRRQESERRHREAEEREREARKQRHTMRFIQLDGLLHRMRELGREAMQEAEGVPFDEEERQILAGTLNDVRRAVDALDETIMGRRPANWREEVRIMEGGVRQ